MKAYRSRPVKKNVKHLKNLTGENLKDIKMINTFIRKYSKENSEDLEDTRTVKFEKLTYSKIRVIHKTAKNKFVAHKKDWKTKYKDAEGTTGQELHEKREYFD